MTTSEIHPNTPEYDRALSLLDDIDNADSVTRWEADFIDAMLKWTDAQTPITPGQMGSIKRIHAERCR